MAPDALHIVDDQMAEERLDAARDVIQYDHPEDRHCEFYGMMVHRYEELFLGFIWIFDISMDMKRLGAWNQHGIMHIQLAASRDLIHWERLGNRQPFIERGEPEEWDCGMIHFNSYPIVIGDEVRVYYTGNYTPHPMTNQEIALRWQKEAERGLRLRGGAIGLATVPRDRFVSLDAGEAEGYLRTRPFKLPEGSLHLNVDASEGQVIATLCDPEGQSLSGWEQSEPVSGDRLDAEVSWPSGDLDLSRGQRVSLILRARNARLFSYWFA